MDAYFGKDGSQYTTTRISIGSCDFSTKFYDYCHDPSIEDDKDGKASRENTRPDPGALLKDSDGNPAPDLKWFTIEGQDTEQIIPAIKKANKYVAEYADNADGFPHNRKELTVFAAPWSPPAWMKGNGLRPGVTALGGTWMQIKPKEYDNHRVKEEYYPAYANYFIKYLEAMKSQGIDIYSLSLNNEAENHPAWEMCLWKAEHAAKFIKENLGPALKKFEDKEGRDVKLLVWDWDRPNQAYAGIKSHADGFDKWNEVVLGDKKALKYVDGIAFHWYGGLGNAGTAWGRSYDLLTKFGKAKSEGGKYSVELYASEACQENGPVLREWFPARRYIYDMINTFEHGSRSWIDWNLLLDENGGPTHEVTNKCHAPIHVDTKGNDNPNDDKLIFNPAYYVLKRMSREVRPGSIRIKTNCSLHNNGEKSDIFTTAFKQKDGSISLLIGSIPGGGLGGSGETYKITVQIKGTYYFELEVPPDSFTVCKFDPSKYAEPETIFTNDMIKEIPEGSFEPHGFVESFIMSKTEITQKMYCDITGLENPVPTKLQGDNKPVTNVNFEDIANFCNALSIKEGKTPYYNIIGNDIKTNPNANGWHLPDENQWRWAAMGASKGEGYDSVNKIYPKEKGFSQSFAGFKSGANAKDYAWYKANSNNSLNDVKGKSANALDLYDMSGNAKEHTSTWNAIWGYVCLGGSYKDKYKDLALAKWPCTKDKAEDIGFRIIRNKN